MPVLVALKPHRYDGRLVRKGQTFAARSTDDATVLKLLGVATDAPPAPAASTAPEPTLEPGPATEPLVPAPTVDPDAADSEKPRRRYRRKDLVAED